MARKPKRSHRAYKEWVPSVRSLDQSFIIITHAWENMKVIKTWRDPTQPISLRGALGKRFYVPPAPNI